MTAEPVQIRGSSIRDLTREMADAGDPHIMRIVATVDAMIRRGAADQLIVPLRRRLAALRPPRPLRFARLMFYPLDRLIIPPARWRPEQQTIPRTAVMPMADHVRMTMGAAATAIEAELAGRTTADIELIGQLGRSFWPIAAGVLADPATPDAWAATELGDAAYPGLAGVVAALLSEAAALDALCAETATGLLPPRAETCAALLGRVVRMNAGALPMMVTLLLDRLPEAASLLQTLEGKEAAAINVAVDEAVDLLLGQLIQPTGTEARIAAGTLAESAAAALRIATLLTHLETPNTEPKRRDRVRAVRQRLNAGCKARFASALQDDLLTPLQRARIPLSPDDITALEAAARGLRVLETEARAIGSGSTYDLLLGAAAEAITGHAMRDRLALANQMRLVEILSGSDAALAMLDQAS